MNFQMFKMDLEKAEEPEIKCQHPLDLERAREFQENMYFCFIDYAKAFQFVDHNSLSKIPKRWEYQTTWAASCRQVNMQQLELDMEQQTGSQLGKEYIKAVYCHLFI